MSWIFCRSNSSMVSSSFLVVRVASMVALWSSLSAWWQQNAYTKRQYKLVKCLGKYDFRCSTIEDKFNFVKLRKLRSCKVHMGHT